MVVLFFLCCSFNNIKNNKKYVKKIDFSHLRRLIGDDDDDALIQQRVYEFFVCEVKEYS